MDFEFDPAKSATNYDKHGIDFVEAQGLWDGKARERPLSYPREDRFLRIGMLRERLWAAVFTLRGERVRLISVRRARRREEAEYERETRKVRWDDHEP